ncbi:MAG: hypothetical protein GY944_09000, partial [bacterium]|nr:hypothetical protein [bacterium]
EKTYAIAVATLERDYQVELAQDLATAATKRQAALAAAELQRDITQIDAHRDWKGTEIDGEVLFLDTNTPQLKITTDAIAGQKKGYANTSAQEQADLEESLDNHEATRFGAEVDADNASSGTQAGADRDLKSSKTSAQANASAKVDTALQSPWSQFKAAEAAARRDWWTTQTLSFDTLTTDVAAEHSTYKSTAVGIFNQHASDVATAFVSAVGTRSTAEETLVKDESDAVEDYVLAMVAPRATYLRAIADARQTYDLDMAAA